MSNDGKNIIKSIFYKKCFYKGKDRYMGYISIRDKHYKVRTTAIIYDNEGKVFCSKYADKVSYYFPGGSLEVDKFNKTSHPPLQILNKITSEECKEECLIEVSNVRYTNICNIFMYPKNIKITGLPDKVYNESGIEDKNFLNKIAGTVSFIFVAERLKKYTGHVDVMDKSPFAKSGVWKRYSEIKTHINLKECEAIEKHVPNSMYNSSENWKIFNHLMN